MTDDPLDFLNPTLDSSRQLPTLHEASQASPPALDLALAPRLSATLAGLPERQRPPASLACGTCPAAVWMAGAATLQSYCMVTKTMSWTREDPMDISECDGKAQAIAAMQQTT